VHVDCTVNTSTYAQKWCNFAVNGENIGYFLINGIQHHCVIWALKVFGEGQASSSCCQAAPSHLILVAKAGEEALRRVQVAVI